MINNEYTRERNNKNKKKEKDEFERELEKSMREGNFK
jgi:hypothetical protein